MQSSLCIPICLFILVITIPSTPWAKRRNKNRSGKDCEKGKHNCHKDATCINTRRSFRCRCKPGFTGNGKSCQDKDECSNENGGCVHTCINSPGNYTCQCFPGFYLAPDGHGCLDKNECLDRRGSCEHQCINTLGSYECRCNFGYSLQSNGRNCQVGTRCKTNLGCEHFCSSQRDGACSCLYGYTLVNGKQCLQTCKHGNGGCQHKCLDTPQGPVCSCADQYKLKDDKKTCRPSCGVKNGGCERKCTDLTEGPVCSCPRGYHLHQDGRSCLDIDECRGGNGGCSHQCVNTRGSYECTCPKGFKVDYDQRSCKDINECSVNGTCDHICVNKPGSHHCECRKGYQLYGVSHCSDVNECSNNNGGCEKGCENFDGGYTCTCGEGYKLHPNNKDCIESTRCIDIKTPAKADMSSTILSGGNRQVIIECKDPRARFTSGHVGRAVYECGRSTDYLWTFEKENKSLATCSETKLPPSFKRKARFVLIMDECHFHEKSLELLKSNLTSLLNEQKKFKCSRKCSLNYLQMNCGSRRKKFRSLVRGTFKNLITAEFELQMDSRKSNGRCDDDCMTKRTQRKLKKAIKALRKTIKKERFSIRYEGIDYDVIKKSFKPDKQVYKACSTGNVLVGNLCIACSIGTYHDIEKSKCLPCPSGTYQDDEGQDKCKQCPSKIADSGMVGASNTRQCIDLCEPGFFSGDGFKPCRSCELGTYQPSYGRTSCMSCGAGIMTRTIASKHFKDCISRDYCLSGYFYDISVHRCVKCKQGTYQPEPNQNFCLACPSGTTNDFAGSKTSEECKNRRCGGYRGRYQGVIETPNYPGNYPVNVGCTWKIKPEKQRRILIIIPEIHLRAEDKCGDRLVIRKSKSQYSPSTFETCESQEKPIAFTARSRKIWINFKSNGYNTSKGFSIPFVTYHEEYQTLIEDIVRDGRLYSSYQHQQIFKDRKLLNALLEVIAQPYNYLKYANVSHTMFPQSFFRLLTPKVRRFFST
ncbi:signal peptide, CUB and EGF-like domain-containing protein 1 isoform X2 [Patella vulgata]|uniref:signal peptide, CUB and EGF-like domain-containing protein 1 isoform X2 n=1 Tax=Patella vulgata TaxID=6465 RepID=UPI00217F9C3B|nr:signal peptide, CUB and EGF-like domain-containing protein 1 isoform X2 [Patella vulgata]